jgi:hypothetical protein
MNTIIDHKSVNDQLKQIITPGGKSYYDLQLRKSRIIALILAVTTLVSLIFLVFAFVQKAAADTAREEAIRNEVRALENERLAAQYKSELADCKSKP